jgi:hypothetical protein
MIYGRSEASRHPGEVSDLSFSYIAQAAMKIRNKRQAASSKKQESI